MNNKDQFNSLLTDKKPTINKPEVIKKGDKQAFNSKFKSPYQAIKAPEVNYRINYEVPYTTEDEAQDDAIIAILTKQLEDLKAELLSDLNADHNNLVNQQELNNDPVAIKQQLNFLENLYKSFYHNDFEHADLEQLVSNKDFAELKKQSYALSKTLSKAQIVFDEINKYSTIIANEITKVDIKPWLFYLNDQEFNSPNQLLTYLFDLKLEAKAKLVNLEQAIDFINNELNHLIKLANNSSLDTNKLEWLTNQNLSKYDLELIKEQLNNNSNKITKTDLEQLREELKVDINQINKQDLELLKHSVINTQLELIEVNQRQLNELRKEHQAQLELTKNSQKYIVDQLAAAIIRQEKILEEKINLLNELRPIHLTEMSVPSTEIKIAPIVNDDQIIIADQTVKSTDLDNQNVLVVSEQNSEQEPVILTKEIDQLNPLIEDNIKIQPQTKVVPEIINQELVDDEIVVNQPIAEIDHLNILVRNIQVENQKFDQIKKQIKDQAINLSDIDSSYVLQEAINVELPKTELNKQTKVSDKTNLSSLNISNYQQVIKNINLEQLKPEILKSKVVDQSSVLVGNHLQGDEIDHLRQKYQEDKKLLELRQEESNAQIQVLNAQIDLLKKQLLKTQEQNQSEIIKKTSEFKDVLENQKIAYETILNQHKQQYENELINSKNDLIRLINEKIQAKTNEFLKGDDQENDFVQIRDTYLKVLNDQQKEYDKQIKQKQSEIIEKLNQQKNQFDDIIKLKNLEWNQYQEILINNNNKALAELENQKQRYQNLSGADQSNIKLINDQIKQLKLEQQHNQSIIDQYNNSKDQFIDDINTTYNKESINLITDQITNKISEKFNEEISRIKENTYNYYPDLSNYYDYYQSYDQYDEGYVDENGIYYEPVDVELDPRILDEFNYDYDRYYDSYEEQNQDQTDQEQSDQGLALDDNSIINDYDNLDRVDDGINHYKTEDVVIMNDKIKEQLANDQSLKIRKPGGWFAKKIYLTQIGEKDTMPQKMSGRRGVFKRVNKGRLSKEEIKKYANKIINSNK
ncbi:hypothetical protein [[Mycoplasma] imitans]|uniref:hypothetical protein n=1 Tax=[Mycoplasma] imitans TaxID=29560 RepID=UPI000488C300|nr:hypothetical protein [[Mycoplasma] imitans]